MMPKSLATIALSLFLLGFTHAPQRNLAPSRSEAVESIAKPEIGKRKNKKKADAKEQCPEDFDQANRDARLKSGGGDAKIYAFRVVSAV